MPRVNELTNLICTVNVLNRKDAAQAKQHNLCKCWNQLRCRHENIHAILALSNHLETCRHQRCPVVCNRFYFTSHLQPLITFRSQNATNTVNQMQIMNESSFFVPSLQLLLTYFGMHYRLPLFSDTEMQAFSSNRRRLELHLASKYLVLLESVARKMENVLLLF